MNRTMLRLMPYFVLVLCLAAIGIFLFSRGNNTGGKAKYTSGVTDLELDGTAYTMVNDILAESYVGSKVKSVVGAQSGKQAGVIKTMAVFTVAKLFRVEGDEDGRYLIDNLGRLYARSDIAEELKSRLATDDGLPVRKIVTSAHSPLSARDLSAEEIGMLTELQKNGGEETTIKDVSFVTDYSNRREIFAFTEDGLLYKVVTELFLYRGSVYLTTGFEGDKNTAKEQKLTGVKLPEEWQSHFAEYWK